MPVSPLGARAACSLRRSKHRGLTAPSANSFGRISPSTAQHVREDLGEKPAGKLDLILDGGPCEFGIESTMINLSGSRPEILRHGVITRAMLEEVLDCPVPDAGADAPRASGRLKSHYAPKTRAELLPAARLPERAAELASEGIVLAVMGPQMLRALLPANAELAAFVEAPDDVLSYGASSTKHSMNLTTPLRAMTAPADVSSLPRLRIPLNGPRSTTGSSVQRPEAGAATSRPDHSA